MIDSKLLAAACAKVLYQLNHGYFYIDGVDENKEGRDGT